MNPESNAPQFVDAPHAPEFFVSFLKGAAFDGPNVHLTFFSSRVDHSANPGGIKDVVNVRLVMSIPSAQNMVVFLSDFLAKAALNALPPPPTEAMQ